MTRLCNAQGEYWASLGEMLNMLEEILREWGVICCACYLFVCLLLVHCKVRYIENSNGVSVCL